MAESSRTILTKVTFKENCEYEGSEETKELVVPRQDVEVNLSLNNLTANLEQNYKKRHESVYMTNGTPNNYYTDILRFTASVHLPSRADVPVRAGYVEFYWQPANSPTRKLLNKPTTESKTCLLNQKGQVAIDLQPKTSGTLYAQYIDENDNYIADEVSYELIMREMPVTIEFTQAPPFIASVHDEVEIEATVKNINGEYIDYGLVTFLHYTIKDSDMDDPTKRVETIIGNPVIVNNGKAKIKYIPVQTDDDTEPESLKEYNTERHVEYIRAVYNYDSKGTYGSQWKYYQQKATWTSIAIAKYNSLTIGVEGGNSNLDINLAYNYFESETDTIKIYGYLYDKKGNNIKLNDTKGINLRYYLKGTHSHPKIQPPSLITNIYVDKPIIGTPMKEEVEYPTKQTFSYIEYEKEITDVEIIETSDNLTAYVITLPCLLPGTYTITAKSDDIQHIISGENNSSNVEYEGSENDNPKQGINNDIYYAKIENSNEILLNIEYDTVDYSITFDEMPNSSNSSFKISGTINIENNNASIIKNLLQNQKCNIYIPQIQKETTASIKLSNDILSFESSLLYFGVSGDYEVQVSIPDGVYSTNFNTNDYHDKNIDFYIPKKSESCNITLVDDFNIDIDIIQNDGKNTYAPCDVTYKLTANNLTRLLTAKLSYKTVSSYSEPIVVNDSIFLSNQNNTFSSDLPSTLNSGTYQLIVEANNKVFTKEFTVTGGRLNYSLPQEMHRAGWEKSLNIILWADSDIQYIAQDKNLWDNISFYISPMEDGHVWDDEEDKTIIRSIRATQEKNILAAEIVQHTYTQEKYWIRGKYKGDNNLQASPMGNTEFVTYLPTPKIQINKTFNSAYEDYTYDFVLSIEDNGENIEYKNSVCIVPVSFYEDQSCQKEVQSGLIVFYEGRAQLFKYYYNITTESWWDKWNYIKFDFNPYNEILINLAKNGAEYNDFTEQFGIYIFDFYEIIQSSQSEVDLSEQVAKNGYKYLYGDILQTSVVVNRPK